MKFNPTTLSHLTECGKRYFIPVFGIFSDSPKRLITNFRDGELTNPMKSIRKHVWLKTWLYFCYCAIFGWFLVWELRWVYLKFQVLLNEEFVRKPKLFQLPTWANHSSTETTHICIDTALSLEEYWCFLKYPNKSRFVDQNLEPRNSYFSCPGLIDRTW